MVTEKLNKIQTIPLKTLLDLKVWSGSWGNVKILTSNHLRLPKETEEQHLKTKEILQQQQRNLCTRSKRNAREIYPPTTSSGKGNGFSTTMQTGASCLTIKKHKGSQRW